MAITCPAGGDDDASRTVYLLKEAHKGTRLETRTRFTAPAAQHSQASMIESVHQAAVKQLVARVKQVAENGWNGLG
ncbi:hypothetical protein GCM10023081_43010 [Arthrobacter ginkgonis]|uniref:Uncharacterized protein n=1 Tax=Arthrobacter ginkgonis TaxID=1630594 RepID=A0ABP7DBK8_9MICC